MKGIVILNIVVSAAIVRGQADRCPSEQETNWEIEMLLRHEDCDKFYKCAFGQPVEQQCPADLYFNIETWECDWQDNVDCKDRNVPGQTTTTTITAEPTITTPELTTTTTNTTTTSVPTTNTTTTPVPTTNTTTTPVPTTNSTTTPVPITNSTTTPVPTTNTTTTPVPTTNTTTTPVPTTNTTTTPVPTTNTTTTPVPTTTPATAVPTTATIPPSSTDSQFLPNGCPVDPHIHWLLPHEEDCNLFYYCVWGRKILRQCPSGLHFNKKLQVCDWAWDAGCTL